MHKDVWWDCTVSPEGEIALVLQAAHSSQGLGLSFRTGLSR